MIEYTIPAVLDSLAGVLLAQYPDYPVYTDANQQGTKVPCFFIFLMPSTIDRQIGNRYFRDLGIDIVFLQEPNVEDGNTEIHQVQEFLDYALQDFTYSDGTETAALHAYECEATVEDQELHYKFHIRQRVSKPIQVVLMQEMEANNVNIKQDDNSG